jgi:gliding motility-associated-like protein
MTVAALQRKSKTSSLIRQDPELHIPLNMPLLIFQPPYKPGISAQRPLWSPPNFLDNAASYTPLFRGPTEQLYTVEITTTTGCVTVDTQMVKIVPHADIYVPSAFTPNDDERNDILRPTLMGIKELHYFRIFNRWGQLMYETKTNYDGWDGRYKGAALPTQVGGLDSRRSWSRWEDVHKKGYKYPHTVSQPATRFTS